MYYIIYLWIVSKKYFYTNEEIKKIKYKRIKNIPL